MGSASRTFTAVSDDSGKSSDDESSDSHREIDDTNHESKPLILRRTVRAGHVNGCSEHAAEARRDVMVGVLTTWYTAASIVWISRRAGSARA